MKLTGAEIIWEALTRNGVDVVFGYPGGAILPAYDALRITGLAVPPDPWHSVNVHDKGALFNILVQQRQHP